MSDLQDLIATNAVRAYNEGFERGATEERERIIKLLEQPQCKTCPNHPGECDVFIAGLQHYISLIKGEQK